MNSLGRWHCRCTQRYVQRGASKPVCQSNPTFRAIVDSASICMAYAARPHSYLNEESRRDCSNIRILYSSVDNPRLAYICRPSQEHTACAPPRKSVVTVLLVTERSPPAKGHSKTTAIKAFSSQVNASSAMLQIYLGLCQ